MASNFSLKQQIASSRASLFAEGFLDHEQFTELEKLEYDPNKPAFIESIVNLFLNETTDDITHMEQVLDETPLDLVKLDRYIYKLKGSSVSIGAKRVYTEVVNMLACFGKDAIDIRGVRSAFSRLKEEFAMLKYKLDAYLGLLRPKDLPAESADSNSPIKEGTSTSGEKEEVGSKPSAD